MTYKQKSQLLIMGGVLLLVFGVYLFSQRIQIISPEILKDTQKEVVESEIKKKRIAKAEAFVDAEGRIRMYSPTQSFSDKTSNEKYLEKLATGIGTLLDESSKKINHQLAKKQSGSQTISRLLKSEPFLGMFYMDELLSFTQDCSPETPESNKRKEKNKAVTYTPENFKLTKIEKTGDTAFLFVKTTERPESTCAEIVFLPQTITSTIKKIYVLVSE
jgi:hypothetical protein